jgi:hypothetical protein
MSTERIPPVATLARAVAIVIALGGVLDPNVPRARQSAPTVAVVGTNTAANAALVAAVQGPLERAGAQVVHAYSAHDAARVVIGDALPISAPEVTNAAPVPTFVFAPSAVAITDVQTPAVVRRTSVVPVAVQVDATPRTAVTLELLDEARVVARQLDTIPAGASRRVALDWAPSRSGVHALTIQAFSTTAPDTVRVTRTVAVDSTPWRVLAYDARPSWSATFVRRALERDSRFDVRVRTVTSRAPQALVTRSTLRAPSSLASLDPQSLDVLVVGAPEALPNGERDALGRLVANAGVPIVLLPDDATPALGAWLGAGAWRINTRSTAVALATAERRADTTAAVLRALVTAAPGALPSGSTPLLYAATQPVVWRQPMGLGDVLVSGALDAWRFRDASQSAFDTFWREQVAAQATRRARPILAEPEQLSLRPDERAPLLLYAASAPSLSWHPERSVDSAAPAARAVPVVATSRAGVWRALLPPLAAGERGQLYATVGGDSLAVPVSVSLDAAPQTALPAAVTTAWANTLGGQRVSGVDALVSAVISAARAQPEPLPWHPMRSAWWIVPFTLALAADWWLRRRRGWR